MTSAPDPDQRSVRRSAARIGMQVSVISALLVVAVFALVAGFLVLEANRSEALEPHDGDIRFAIDPWHLVVVLGGLGVFAIGLAGIATWLIARRATAPIGEALRMQRTFVQDASHELRTPLTVIRARVQQLQRNSDDPAARTRVLSELHRDTRAMSDVVDDLLATVSVADPAPDDPGSDVALVLRECADALQPLAAERGVALVVAGPGQIVRMPRASFRRCMVILLDNAVAHARDGGTVRVDVRRERSWVVVDVADDGAGITGIAPERVFDRFAHGTPTTLAAVHRTGFGIGLALLRELVVRHHGRVDVTATSGTGTVFTLRLPVGDARA